MNPNRHRRRRHRRACRRAEIVYTWNHGHAWDSDTMMCLACGIERREAHANNIFLCAATAPDELDPMSMWALA